MNKHNAELCREANILYRSFNGSNYEKLKKKNRSNYEE